MKSKRKKLPKGEITNAELKARGLSQHDIEAELLPSASGFDAEFRCLGRRALTSQLPSQPENANTLRGQRIHKALEINDLSELAKSDEITASRIMFAEAQLVHQYDFEGAHIEFEQRYWDFDDKMNHTWSARIDRHDWQPHSKRLFVPDYKSGWGIPVPIKRNWQMHSQTSLLGVEYYDAEQAVAALIHPHHPDSLTEVLVYTREQLEAALVSTRENVKRIKEPDQPRTPGPIQCQYCTAKGICPEYQKYIKDLEQSIADEIEDKGFTAINARSEKERGAHVKAIKDMIDYGKLMLERYTELAKRDASAIDGYTLARKTTRHITNEIEAMQLVEGEYGYDVAQSCTRFNIKAFEDYIAEKSGRREAKATVERILRPLLQFKTSEFYLRESRSL